MTMVAGRLDQRVSFWAREDAGADGFVRPVFVYQGTYWGRIDHTAQTQNVGTEPQAEINYRSPARATVADYVAAHECAHLIEANHGPRFWALVHGLVGDHAPHRDWLRREGARLHAFGRG